MLSQPIRRFSRRTNPIRFGGGIKIEDIGETDPGKIDLGINREIRKVSIAIRARTGSVSQTRLQEGSVLL